jgi:hypothetical protein
MKPKMLLIGGWGWSATSPLVYTLQRNAKYAHFGYTKVFRYLGNVKFKLARLYKKVSNNTWENHKSEEDGHRMNLTIDLEPLRDFPLDHFTKLVTGERTISKYVEFYHALYDHVVSKGYKSVGDNYMDRRYKIPQDELEVFKSEFDIKVLFIARDPVRRAVSHYLTKLKEDRQPRQLQVHNYVDVLKSFRKSYGESNVYITVMEELWEGDGAKELSQFLGHPIDNLWKNLYAPDRGHLVQFDKDVPCQAYGQDFLELTPEKYNEIKKQYQHIYDDWEGYYGSLPMYWGQPIEYL